jgi:hypothetical protein
MVLLLNSAGIGYFLTPQMAGMERNNGDAVIMPRT